MIKYLKFSFFLSQVLQSSSVIIWFDYRCLNKRSNKRQWLMNLFLQRKLNSKNYRVCHFSFFNKQFDQVLKFKIYNKVNRMIVTIYVKLYKRECVTAIIILTFFFSWIWKKRGRIHKMRWYGYKSVWRFSLRSPMIIAANVFAFHCPQSRRTKLTAINAFLRFKIRAPPSAFHPTANRAFVSV